MCAQNLYAVATLNTTATINTKETTATTAAAATSNNCMCCYQLKTCYVKSSCHANTQINTKITTQSTTRTITLSKNIYNLRDYLIILTTVLALVEHCSLGVCAAPQSCVLCDINDLKANSANTPSVSYEEFLFEHQVTRQDAIHALKMLNDSFYDGPSPELSCKSVSCTKAIMKYCLSPQFINDHCWCELGHSDEGLPFIPHICYVGEKTYSPSVGSCFFYENLKECCCAPTLAKQWRHISGAPKINNLSNVLLAILTLMLAIVRRGSF